MRHFLAFDAGTGSGRCVIFDEAGNELAAVSKEWWHASDPRYPGSMDFDTQTNWSHLARCCKSVIAKAGIAPESIAAVSATSMREAFVLHDASGSEIWACANVDARAEAEVVQLKKTYPGLEEELYALSGQTFALGALPRLLWLKNNAPDILERACKLTMLSEWVLYRLSGALVCEASNAGTTGLIGLGDGLPIEGVLERIGIDQNLFPAKAMTGEKVGTLSKIASRETGLPEGTLVVTGGGDCQIGTLGLGVVKKGACAVLGGTFWQQVVNVPASFTDPDMRLRVNPHVVDGLAQVEAISFFTGAVMRWFRDTFGSGRSYSELEALSKQVPAGAHGIIPIFSDVMRYNAWIHAAPSLLNLSLEPQKSSPAAIFRALQENAAIVAARNLNLVFTLTGSRPDHITFAGGASKSAHWSQILADVTGIKVVTPKVKEATALGCAAAASVGAGAFETLEEAATTWSNTDQTFEPNRDLFTFYEEAGERWARAYSAQRALVDEGITTAMWRAPGV